jgi:hypothetical protein
MLLPSTLTVAAEETGTSIASVESLPALIEKDGKTEQLLRVKLAHTGPSVEAVVDAGDGVCAKVTLNEGEQTADLSLPAIEAASLETVHVTIGGKMVSEAQVELKPVRQWTIYLMPHSHVDIGYTKVQTEVERDQMRFLDESMEAARKTAKYPAGAQFKWNSEVLWAVDAWLKEAPKDKRTAFIRAVKDGWIELNALYGNELTALCRPEELVRLLGLACRLRKEHGVPIQSAMISDVPGYTWGMVPVMAGSGVKYFSIGPNPGDRIGFTLNEWGDRPFYWVSPAGNQKILCWVHGRGYASFHRGPLRDGERIFEYLHDLEETRFPYDLVGLRYNIGGDNGPPDVQLSEFVRDWNARYRWPRVLIATASEMFREFERRYGDDIPSVSGDFTPYWEDGAASSALETAINRSAAERLVQAETLWSMLDPKGYPEGDFREAWRNVILYDEHTWGAHNSISEPDSEFAQAQWKIKQAFAVDAGRQSHQLLDRALEHDGKPPEKIENLLVFNTNSWPRTDLVILPSKQARAGNQVMDGQGKVIASQVLSNGDLAILAPDIPPFGSRKFRLVDGEPSSEGSAKALGATLSNGLITLSVDTQTGALNSLKNASLPVDLVDTASGMGLNDYRYVPGKDPAGAQKNGAVQVRVLEEGPLVASLRVESEAPGCRKLTREVRVLDGINRVEITNRVDKEKVREKEGVHFAFPFNVPEGVVRMDIPWAVARPEADQIPGSCKNWFTVQRWVDISSQDFGVTWSTLDAPLVELGAITAETPWMKSIASSQTLYSYVMNNYWHTNYKADQEGPVVFRYALQPHGQFESAAAARFGMESSQPLIPVPVGQGVREVPSLLSIAPEGVLAAGLEPVDGGRSLLLRLFGASGKPEQVRLEGRLAAGGRPRVTDLSGGSAAHAANPLPVLPYELVTLKVRSAAP